MVPPRIIKFRVLQYPQLIVQICVLICTVHYKFRTDTGSLVNCLNSTGDVCDIGTLRSPNFPGHYGNQSITWIITATVGNFITLEFDALHLAKDQNGNCLDWLLIYQSGSAVGDPYKRYIYHYFAKILHKYISSRKFR